MKVFNNFEEMLEGETDERKYQVIMILLRNLAHYYEETFIEEPYMLNDDEALQLADVINDLHFSREELIGLLLRFTVDLLEDGFDEDDTIQ